MSIVMEFPDTVDEFMEQYKSTDTECVYSNGIEYVPIFRMKQWFEHLKVKPKTNADHIRSMTDEELANAWWEYIDCYECPITRECTMLGKDCKRRALAWLKEEVKE